jgi:hypothetical protein
MALIISVVLVSDDIIFRESGETIKYQFVEIGLIDVFTDEFCKTGQIPAGHGFMIYMLQDDFFVDMQFFPDGIQAFLWHVSSEEIRHHFFAKPGTAAFIAEYEAEGWDIFNYLIAVVPARSGARAQYADDTGLVTAQCPSRADQV